MNILVNLDKSYLSPLQIISLIQFKTNMKIGDWVASLKLSRATVYRVIDNTSSNKDVRTIIEQTLDLTEKELWPEKAEGKEQKE